MQEKLADLQQRWSSLPFTDCSKGFVLGEFNFPVKFLCLGEALGEEEVKQNRPFIGEAGQRLRSSLKKKGVRNEVDLSFTNVLPRRPYDKRTKKNRTPEKEEQKVHTPFVRELVALLQPKIVYLLGNVPLKAFTGREKITEERGQEFTDDDFPGTIFVPTFHPANTLYRPSATGPFENDLEWGIRLATGNVLDAKTLSFPFLDDGKRLRGLITEQVEKSEYVYFDVEAGAQPPARAIWHWDDRVQIILVSLAWFVNERPCAAVIEWNDSTAPVLRELLEGDTVKLVGQNVLQYDAPLLEKKRIRLRRPPVDTYLIARTLNENDTGGLKARLRSLLGLVNYTPYRTKTEEEHWHDEWYHWPEMTAEERDERIRYSGVDAWGGIQDFVTLSTEFKKHPKLHKVYRELVSACGAAVEMERTGVPVNIKKLAKMLGECFKIEREAVAKIRSLLPPDAWETVKPSKKRKKDADGNHHINPGSTQQLGKILFNIYNLPSIRLTEAGAKTTNEDALLQLLGLKGHPDYEPEAFEVLEQALLMREKRQLKNMFLIPILDQIRASPTDEWRRARRGILHGRFHVAGTDTLRFASSDPNLQNWPRKLREIVEAPDGWVFINADFSGLEGRGAANESRDRLLVDLFTNGVDLHWFNTVEFLGLPKTATRKDKPEYDLLRYAIKTLYFASIYGALEKKIAEVMRKKLRDASVDVQTIIQILTMKGVDSGRDPFLALAKAWREWMFNKFPGLKRWHWRVEQEVTRTGEIETWSGFVRHLPDALSTNPRNQQEAVRQAINVRPQALSLLAQISLNRLREIRDTPEPLDDWCSMAQVHDSISILCREDVAPDWAEIVKEVMERDDVWSMFGTTFAVPLVAEVTIKRAWEEQK